MSDAASSATAAAPIRAVPDFDAFYAREYGTVLGLAYALSGSRLGAEDICQEAFLDAYRRWGDISGYDNPGAWVRRVVANRAVSAYRRRSAEIRAITRLRGRAQPLDELDPASDEVWRAVRKLPHRQAQAVALFYVEDASLSDVATTLQCSIETVRTHLRRARKTLSRELASQDLP